MNTCCCCSVAKSYLTLRDELQHTRLPCPEGTISLSLLKLMSIELVMPSNHLILCHPLLLLPSIFPNIRIISNELVPCIRWPKYWNFSFITSPSIEYSGLISFRIDWFESILLNHKKRKKSCHLWQRGRPWGYYAKRNKSHGEKTNIIWFSSYAEYKKQTKIFK